MGLDKFIGLKGGPNEKAYSTEGYKADSPDRFNPVNVIPSSNITMKGVNHPVYGEDELGNGQMMFPGNDYKFPGSMVTEIPIAQSGKIVKGVFNQYPGLYNIADTKDFKVSKAKGQHLEHLETTGRGLEYFPPGDTWYPFQDTTDKKLSIPGSKDKHRILYNPNLENPEEAIMLDIISHAYNTPEAATFKADLNSKLRKKYGDEKVDANGGVDAYIRGYLSNLEEYAPYKKEMEFLPEGYFNPFMEGLKKKQDGGAYAAYQDSLGAYNAGLRAYLTEHQGDGWNPSATEQGYQEFLDPEFQKLNPLIPSIASIPGFKTQPVGMSKQPSFRSGNNIIIYKKPTRVPKPKPISSMAPGVGPSSRQEGGEYIEIELSPEEIAQYKEQGFEVEELAQVGGAIQVDDPNDPRLHSYMDSLNLYKAYQKQLELDPPQSTELETPNIDYYKGTSDDAFMYKDNQFQNVQGYEEGTYDELKAIPEKGFDSYKVQAADLSTWKTLTDAEIERQKRENAKGIPTSSGIPGGPVRDIEYIKNQYEAAKYYDDLTFSGDTKTGYYQSADLGHKTIKPTDSYFGSAWNPVYAKPVQPYEYKGDPKDVQATRFKPGIEGGAEFGTRKATPDRSTSSLERERLRDETEKKMMELTEAGLYSGPIRGRGAEDNPEWQEALSKFTNTETTEEVQKEVQEVTPVKEEAKSKLPEGYERVFHPSRSNESEQYDIYYRDPSTGSRKRIATGDANWEPGGKPLVSKQDGGEFEEVELSPQEIKRLRAQGYRVEEVPEGYHEMPDGTVMADADHKAQNGRTLKSRTLKSSHRPNPNVPPIYKGPDRIDYDYDEEQLPGGGDPDYEYVREDNPTYDAFVKESSKGDEKRLAEFVTRAKPDDATPLWKKQGFSSAKDFDDYRNETGDYADMSTGQIAEDLIINYNVPGVLRDIYNTTEESANRIVDEPWQTTKDVGNTIADAASFLNPFAIGSAGDILPEEVQQDLIEKGLIDPNAKNIFGEDYWANTQGAMDVLNVAPFLPKGLGKLAKGTKSMNTAKWFDEATNLADDIAKHGDNALGLPGGANKPALLENKPPLTKAEAELIDKLNATDDWVPMSERTGNHLKESILSQEERNILDLRQAAADAGIDVPPVSTMPPNLQRLFNTRPTRYSHPEQFNKSEEIGQWFERWGSNTDIAEKNAALAEKYPGQNITMASLDKAYEAGIPDTKLASKVLRALRKSTDDFRGWEPTISRTNKINANKSNFTKEELLNSERLSIKDKDYIVNLSDDQFKNTIVTPKGDVIPHEKYGKTSYSDKSERYHIEDALPITTEDYVDVFNSRLDLLNDIIRENNTSGVNYEVTGLTPYGKLNFYTPPGQKGILPEGRVPVDIAPGESKFNTNINPALWRGEVPDHVFDKDYIKGIPGIEMVNSLSSVFPDKIPRRGTGTYESINQYLKALDLGRVKPGFNSQTKSAKSLWENMIKKNKAVGYYGNTNTIYGTMKTALPVAGTAAAAAAYGNPNSPLPKDQLGGEYKEVELTDQEITALRAQGYNVEEL